MSSKSRFRGKRKERPTPAVAPLPLATRRRQGPPDLDALGAALKRCRGRAEVKVLPDIHGRACPVVTFADDAAKAEFERVFAEELATRRVVVPEAHHAA